PISTLSLRDALPILAVVEADPVPVHGGRQIQPVGELDDDARALVHVDQRPRVLAVEAVHDEGAAAKRAAHEPGLEPERVAVAQADELPRAGVRERRRVRGWQERRDGRPGWSPAPPHTPSTSPPPPPGEEAADANGARARSSAAPARYLRVREPRVMAGRLPR